MTSVIKQYYLLTKPGIIRGNLLTVVAGFLFGSAGTINISTGLFVVFGSILTIASGCVANNILDRELDKQMTRTKKRALVTGEISIRAAQLFSALLGIVGLGLLLMFVNHLTAFVGLIGWLLYVFLYGYYKRRSPISTWVGSLAGAIPVLSGYTAATNQLTVIGIILFVIMAVWQIPHFLSIAIYRKAEYKKAKLPLLSITKGTSAAVQQLKLHVYLYVIVSSLPYWLGYAGVVYGGTMLAACVYWLYYAQKSNTTKDIDKWAKQMFGVSLVVLLIYCVALATNPWL